MRCARFLFIAVVLCLPGAVRGQDIVERYLDSIGGRKSWLAVRTIIEKGEYDYGGIKFPFTTWSKTPDSYKFLVPSNGKFYAQAYRAGKGWKIDGFKNENAPTLLSGPAARDLANESEPELTNAFISMSEKDVRRLVQHDTTINGATAVVVGIANKNGDRESYYFDRTSALLIMKKARSKNSEMKGAPLTTFFSDYRKVKGIRMPFKTVHSSDGQAILTITTESVDLDKPVNDALFQP